MDLYIGSVTKNNDKAEDPHCMAHRWWLHAASVALAECAPTVRCAIFQSFPRLHVSASE